jgi:hypothetical protein
MAGQTVFISSTYKDLKEYRRKVWDVLKRFDLAVRGMEQFGARTEAPLETCLLEVEESDVYVGILAYRLGSVEPNSRKPFTILEYERAVEQKKEILIYMADDETASFPQASVDQDTQSKGRLKEFKDKLRERHTVVTFSTPEDLGEKLSQDFKKKFATKQEEPGAESNEEEFAKAEHTLTEFLLTPKRYNAYGVRLSVRFNGDVFPASRDLCQRFNLDYGFTIGAYMNIVRPKNKGGSFGFHDMYASGNNVDPFRELVKTREAEVYAQLRFSEEDVKSVNAIFLGYSYYDYDYEDGGSDPHEIYVPPEGKSVLIFSKAA